MSLNVEVHAQNMSVDDRLNDYVTTKVSKLDRYLSDIDVARVDLTYAKNARDANDRQVAQITIRGKRFVLRAEERTDDIYSALDSAVDKIQRRISRFKGKRARNRGDGTSVADLAADAMEMDQLEQIEDESLPEVVRRKKFLLLPMNELEAIEQMELLGHQDFFIYYDPDSDSINVLYRRRDDSLGLIETEIG
ncbi:MAG: ribosome-associated translation inhibitor RaiA [Chloroflexi bacterium]|nr:MAG: ribosome-associated translation inhibitor RaiA [Chloroflexota bacterium]MBL1195547.1 ribosome-associated translation inhibitor RaiA [Chloroflexota bacterium]NOH12830.1 ribosome-associated translation inhibitor RaiA [Chloroflexota bacterium]